MTTCPRRPIGKVTPRDVGIHGDGIRLGTTRPTIPGMTPGTTIPGTILPGIMAGTTLGIMTTHGDGTIRTTTMDGMEDGEAIIVHITLIMEVLIMAIRGRSDVITT